MTDADADSAEMLRLMRDMRGTLDALRLTCDVLKRSQLAANDTLKAHLKSFDERIAKIEARFARLDEWCNKAMPATLR